jgi:hypothetical protein
MLDIHCRQEAGMVRRRIDITTVTSAALGDGRTAATTTARVLEFTASPTAQGSTT